MFSKKNFSSVVLAGILALGFLNVTGALGMGEPIDIIEKGAQYQSGDITAHVGQTIRLINKDPFFHQSQIRKVDQYGIEYPLVVSVLETEGATVEVSLPETGKYKLRCKVHDGMLLNINVIQ